MKSINIYLFTDDKAKLDAIRTKYKISLSTMADKLCLIFYKYMINYPFDIERNLKLLTEYQLEESWNVDAKHHLGTAIKTSIKPKSFSKYGILNETNINPTKFISNVLWIYANKLIDRYIQKDHINNFYNEINKEWYLINEKYWNYNNAVRNQTRAIRMNKEYYRRILEE